MNDFKSVKQLKWEEKRGQLLFLAFLLAVFAFYVVYPQFGGGGDTEWSRQNEYKDRSVDVGGARY